MTATEAEEALGAALAAWTTPECSHTQPFFAGWVDELPQAADGQNTVAWVQDWTVRKLPASAPGNTDVQYLGLNGDWRIAEADIYLDAQGFGWGAAAESEGASVDLRAVLTHELGHALGLLHPCEPDGSDGAPVCGQGAQAEAEATMFPLYDSEQASLASDDVDGICYLYPAVTDACGGCGRNEICVDTECHAQCGESVCELGEVCGFWGCVNENACRDRDCAGRDCSEDTACGGFERCVRGTCQAGTKAWGDMCAASSDCEKGACVDGVCQPRCNSDAECGPQGACRAALEGSLHGCESSGAYGLGLTCNAGEDCSSGLCVFTDAGAACTKACQSSDSCPTGWGCETVEGREVCVPEAISTSGGCAVRGGRERGVAWELLSFVSALTAVARRRRKCSRSRQ